MTKQPIPRLVPEADAFALGAKERSPIEVLRAQTDYWGEATGGLIVGEVERTVTAPDRVAYWFSFVVPALDDYRYRLFLVEHGLEFYPVWISSGRDDAQPVEVRDEEALFDELKTRFRAERTMRIVRQLRALAMEALPHTEAAGGG